MTTPATELRGSILGTRVLRREDPDLITGRAAYVDDIAPADAAHVVYVTSPVAHARGHRVLARRGRRVARRGRRV